MQGLVAVKRAAGDSATNEDDYGITRAIPHRADVQQLEHVSFSREQIAGLLQSHSTLSAGVYHED